MRAQKRSVNLLESYEFNDEEDQTEEINFLGGQGNYQNRGFNPNFRNHPNLSDRSTNIENPGHYFYPPRSTQNKGNFQNNAGYGKMGFNSQPGNAVQLIELILCSSKSWKDRRSSLRISTLRLTEFMRISMGNLIP